MKKNIYKILTAVFAMAMIVASPATTLTTHALGFNPDAYDDTDYGKRPSSSSSDSGNSYSEPSISYSESSSSYSEPDNSHNESNYGSDTGIGFNADASDNTDYGVKPAKNPNDVIVRVTGGQPFHNVMSKDHTSYQVYHCGDSKVTFEVTDAEGNAVTYKTVTLEQGEDKLWYEKIVFPENVETKDFTIAVTKGDASYLSTLGVSGVKINGTVVLSTVPSEPVQVDEDSVIGHRYCSCGASFDIRENGGIDKDAWNAHMREHAAKGESARYTDK